jgi:hypothetical protein
MLFEEKGYLIWVFVGDLLIIMYQIITMDGIISGVMYAIWLY